MSSEVKLETATSCGAEEAASGKARKKLGKDISFGMQQTVACWSTDLFVDPYIGKKFQERFGDRNHKATLGQTWAGEVVGDTAAFFAFLGIQTFAPGVTNGLAKMARAGLKPLERTGRAHLKAWAVREQIDPQGSEYHAKLEEWKDKQAENVAKTSIISASSVAFNVATQKLGGNKNKLAVITTGKLMGAVITMGSVLALRNLLPKSIDAFDEELNERYIAPLIRRTQKAVGAKEDKKLHHHDDSRRHLIKSSDVVIENALVR